MKIEKKLKDIPRSELDALEKLVRRILRKESHFDYSAEELVNKKWKPVAGITFSYGQGKTREAVSLIAEGTTREGDFEVDLKLNLTDDVYSLITQNLEKKAPILAKSLPKLPSYSS